MTTGNTMPEFNFWQSSRAIPTLSIGDCALVTKECASITEFPFFSFLYGDLHAHLISMPFSLLVIGLSLAIILANLQTTTRKTYLTLFMLLALTVGSLQAINAWDYPTFLIISLGALVLAEYTKHQTMNRKILLKAGYWSVLLIFLSMFLFLPYHATNETFNLGVHGSIWQTPLYVYLAIHAVFVLIIATFLIEHIYRIIWPHWDLRIWWSNITQVVRTPNLAITYSAVIITPLVTIVLLSALGYGTVAFLFLLFLSLLCIGIYYVTTYHPSSPHILFVVMLTTIAFGLGIAV
jgi:uncharacterized membrane protein